MKVSGTYTFDGPRDKVWQLLNDVEALSRAIPGCKRLEPIGENHYAADIKLGLAGIKGDYSGTVQLADFQPPQHYRMQVQGKGSNGFVQGSGSVDLEEQAGKTQMRYTGEAQIGGPLAGIGQRLLDGAARTVINQSLKALNAELQTRMANGNSASAPASEQQPAPAAASQSSSAKPSAATAPAPAVSQPTPRPPAAPPPPGLTASDVLRGVADDLIAQRPYLRWVLPATLGFLVGFLFGRAGRG